MHYFSMINIISYLVLLGGISLPQNLHLTTLCLKSEEMIWERLHFSQYLLRLNILEIIDDKKTGFMITLKY